jgi:ABC-type bacteriocin/lantibiotic exporter with double-glycine peptidase domain
VVQKIKLARAIVNRPSILLLDEPLEHLIPEETEIISKFLMAKNHNWTVIVVSDCPHLTPLADKIIHLK